MADDKGGTPPGGGRMTHDVMHRAAEMPIEGGGAPNTLAASGGLELPGGVAHGHPHEQHDATEEEPIPGERERNTATHSERGIIAGTGYGENIPADQPDTMDEVTHREHAREGGGDLGQRAKQGNRAKG